MIEEWIDNERHRESSLMAVACEMSMLRTIKVDENEVDTESHIIPFSCKSQPVLRFFVGMVEDLIMFYELYGEITVSSEKNKYILSFTPNDRRTNLSRAFMSLASMIDAAACDCPEMYKWDEI